MRRRFQRARKPEEKEVRRQAILSAARKLLGEVGTDALSLNELARRSGVSKPNVYRYFESREDVLLHVWIEEVRDLGEGLETSLASVVPGDIDGVIAALVASFVARPKLCELMSIVSPVLERNLSSEAIVRAKESLATLTLHIARLLHARVPAVSLVDCGWLAATASTWVAGIWPGANPPPAAIEALSRPDLAPMRVVFDREFTRFLTVVFRGLAAPRSAP